MSDYHAVVAGVLDWKDLPAGRRAVYHGYTICNHIRPIDGLVCHVEPYDPKHFAYDWIVMEGKRFASLEEAIEYIDKEIS